MSAPPRAANDGAIAAVWDGAAAAETLGEEHRDAGRKTVELLGANHQPLRLVGDQTTASVGLDPAVRGKVSASFQGVAAAAPAGPDRVFLNLENVRGLQDATAFNVYINVPEGEDPKNYPDHLAGSVALFGVRKATVAEGQHAGDGSLCARAHSLSTGCILVVHLMRTSCMSGWCHCDQCRKRQISIGQISVFRRGPDRQHDGRSPGARALSYFRRQASPPDGLVIGGRGAAASPVRNWSVLTALPTSLDSAGLG